MCHCSLTHTLELNSAVQLRNAKFTEWLQKNLYELTISSSCQYKPTIGPHCSQRLMWARQLAEQRYPVLRWSFNWTKLSPMTFSRDFTADELVQATPTHATWGSRCKWTTRLIVCAQGIANDVVVTRPNEWPMTRHTVKMGEVVPSVNSLGLTKTNVCRLTWWCVREPRLTTLWNSSATNATQDLCIKNKKAQHVILKVPRPTNRRSKPKDESLLKQNIWNVILIYFFDKLSHPSPTSLDVGNVSHLSIRSCDVRVKKVG